MDYKLIPKPNPQDRTAPDKYYAQFVLGEKIGLRKLAREIVGRSALTLGDVESCLENLIDVLPTLILMGHAVQLGEFCTIRPTAHSYGALTPGEWQVSNLYKVTLTFTPGVLIKERLKEDITLRLVSTKEEAKERRVSRAKALLKDPAHSAQVLKEHIESLSPEDTQELLRTLTRQVAEQAKAQAAASGTPTDTPSDASANPDTKSKK